MVLGAATTFIWGKTDLAETLYVIVPGFLVCLIVTIIVSLITSKSNAEIEEAFNKTKHLMKESKVKQSD